MNEVSAEWRELLCSLPGYSPFAHAEGCWFDVKAAERAIAFCETCVITEGDDAGKPVRLTQFQKAFMANLVGWKMRDEEGRIVRRYREALLYIPRGNGKTVFASLLCLFFLLMDKEPGAQIYGAANTREQATLLYRHAKGFIDRSPALKKVVKRYDSSKTMTLVSDPLSFYRAIPAEEAPAYGYKTYVALIDELHTQPNRNLADAITSSMGTRSQPLTIYMTTADWIRESFCNEVYGRGCQIRDNSMNPSTGYADARFLPCIYEAEADADWKDEKVWAMANPNLGVTVKWRFLRDEFQKAITTPAYENTFRRMYLNQRTESDVRAIDAEHWNACGHGAEPISWRQRMLEDMVGVPCVAGLDLGATNDLTALVFLFDKEKPKVVLPFFWATEAAVERRRRNRVPYDVWVQQGFLKTTSGNRTDYGVVQGDIVELCSKYPIREAYPLGNAFVGRMMLAVDRLFQGEQMLQQLENEGVPSIAFGQGFMSMAMPTKRLLAMVAGGEIDHGNNPVLSWMAGNASTLEDPAGNQKFSKKHSGDKVDGIVALTMAVGLAEAVPEEESLGVFVG